METRTSSAKGKAPPPYWLTAGFLLAGACALWFPTGWMARSLRALHDQRGLTPATVTGPAGAEPALSRRPPAELRADPAGDRSVLFRLLAPAAQEVLLGGTFNDFDASRHPMTRTPEGVWEAALVLPVGRYGYKFKVDGNWRLDPTNPEQTPAPRESSLIDVQ